MKDALDALNMLRKDIEKSRNVDGHKIKEFEESCKKETATISKSDIIDASAKCTAQLCNDLEGQISDGTIALLVAVVVPSIVSMMIYELFDKEKK